MFKELFTEAKINLYKLRDEDVKISRDRDTNKNVAEWIYAAKISDVLTSREIDKTTKSEVKKTLKSMKGFGITSADSIFDIWSSMDNKVTDQLLNTVQANGLIYGGRDDGKWAEKTMKEIEVLFRKIEPTILNKNHSSVPSSPYVSGTKTTQSVVYDIKSILSNYAERMIYRTAVQKLGLEDVEIKGTTLKGLDISTEWRD